MSSEQALRGVSSQIPPTNQGYVELLEHMLEESFAKMLPTLKLYMDALGKNLELISTLGQYEVSTNDTKYQVLFFLQDCRKFIDVLADVNPTIKIIRDGLRIFGEIEAFAPNHIRDSIQHISIEDTQMHFLHFFVEPE
ncbi:unnamed protein product [Rodentolepis nana]|uniref:DHC_N1 domain-containing protein n=1 Tax=Rodentolepis nana TaxID=102285 RepID=A0A0R3T7C9_RODNA|nr:unnamed protein product [Rodentolepis nana]